MQYQSQLKSVPLINTLIFDLSEVLIPGLIGVEERLSEALGIDKHLITAAMGSHPHYVVGNHLDQLFVGQLSHADYIALLHVNLKLEADVSDVFTQNFLQCFRTAYPYSVDLIESLAGRYRLLLHTDHCRVWVEEILRMHPFLSRFSGTITRMSLAIRNEVWIRSSTWSSYPG